MQSDRRKPDMFFDGDQTHVHIFASGKEIMLAAQSVLKLCREFARSSTVGDSKKQLIHFFNGAIAIASDFSRGLARAERAARQELKQEKAAPSQVKKEKRKKTKTKTMKTKKTRIRAKRRQ